MEWIGFMSVFGGAFLLSSLLVPVMIRLAFRYDILDHPGYHKTHVKVHPLLGGGAIYLAFLTIIFSGIAALLLVKSRGIGIYPELQRHLLDQYPVFLNVLPQLFGFLVGGTCIFILGLIDDTRGVGFSYRWKFVIQILAAAILVLSGTRLEF